MIEEELAILEAVQGQAVTTAGESYIPKYDQDLLDLRDSLAEAHEDEIAQIVTQMDQLTHVSTHQEKERYAAVHRSEAPYFGHLRVEQGERVLDLLIGNRANLTPGVRYPIIDWREAPISRVYFSYREGDEYEEELGGRIVEGVVRAHRAVLILGGRLVRVDCPLGVFQCTRESWHRVELDAPALQGGAGTAFRPGNLGEPLLGTGAGDTPDLDKHLKAITGLIDPHQFELITKPEAGIVVIDGGAGSGKTTIALHRMAYLNYQDAERFHAHSMMAVVFNKALAAYISELLPALGVINSRIEVYEAFVEGLRRRHYPHMPEQYDEGTPLTVVRFKQHPAALAVLAQRVAVLTDEWEQAMGRAVAGTDSEARVWQAWQGLSDQPYVPRLQAFARWIKGGAILPEVGKFGSDWIARQRLRRLVDEALPDPQQLHRIGLALWEEAFVHMDVLQAEAERVAPGEFSPGQLAEIQSWALHHHDLREEARQWKQAQAEGTLPQDRELPQPEAPLMDREDDPLLLLVHTLLVGPLRGRRQKPLRLGHLMIDEAQDFGPLDLRLLFGLAAEPRSVTLAGDTSQRMILHSGFDSWEDVLRHLGLEGTPISPLQIGYRSTGEIMRFARQVLGPLDSERPWRAVRQGVPVELFRFTDVGQAVMMLSSTLRHVMRTEPAASVALVTRYPGQADLYFKGLSKTDLPRLRRVREQDFSFRPGIEVTDINQVKGLEFDYVVLLDADVNSYPEDAASRYLLHIGATRSAHQLWLIACREPSPLIPADIVPRFV